MGETDLSFRQLLRGLPRPILQLAFPERRLEPLGAIDPSVDRPRQRTADNLFRVRDGEGEAAVHVEIERAWRAELPARLFEYASAATVATRLPVWSVVLLLRPGGSPPRDIGEYRIPGIGGDAFVFRYRVVPLWQLDARRMRASLGVQGAPFCVAMRGADAPLVRSLADEVRADRELTEADRHTTMQLLYIVSAAILGGDTARRIFHMESLMQSPGVQDLIREWADRGRVEGRAEGRVEGRVEHARAMLHRVLQGRGIAVTADLRARIDAEPDLARLDAWLDAALTARSADDVFGAG